MASEWLFAEDSNEEKASKSQYEELLVFGYACKLFRDDEQAKVVDGGSLLIPWMGDEKLKIDRYDGRGHLYDLRPYDADNRKGVPDPVLTADEKNIEFLCDEERYLELHTDMAEKTMYEEEEWKRYYESLEEGYKAVGFSYDAYGNPQQYAQPEAVEQKPDELPYTPPAELQVPPGVQIPSTIKQNAIIEKTAKFIAEHGLQMEIVMKTKQANNSSFLFMHFEDELHPYYKHMIKMIKSKKYVPVSPVKKEDKDSHNESGDGDSEGYLHPTLMTSNRASPTPTQPYKPIPMPKVSIHETSYGQLLQSFSKVNKEAKEKQESKEIKVEVKTEPEDGDSNLGGQSAYNSSMPPPPGLEPVQLPRPGADAKLTVKQEPIDGRPDASVSPPNQIVPPPPDAQPIIDRMAMYVAKNGEEFSMVVKSKKDPRFQFLENWHPHYAYYDFKRHLFQEEMERERLEKEEEEQRKERAREELMAKGVKFKLKKAKEQDSTTSLEKQTVFEDDESTDDDSDGTAKEKRSKSATASGTSTPIANTSENKTEEPHNEKKLAEQRMRDRIAASAKEKLSQVDKEQQIKMERKKRAAMFINLLKSKNPGETEAETKILEQQSNSGRNTPVKLEDTKSHHKSKHKSRDRSRSRSKEKRSSRSRRSRSAGRSKKKKRKRSLTPPSAYTVNKRLPPPAPPRYLDTRNRYSRSPSGGVSSRTHRSRSRSRGRSTKHRSRSPNSSRSKSKKKKRSRSPKSRKKEESSHSSHKKSSKKKKKKSRSRSKDEKEKTSATVLATVPEEPTPLITSLAQQKDARVSSPAGVITIDDDVTDAGDIVTILDDNVAVADDKTSEADGNETMEEGETRESTPEPGQITDDNSMEKQHMDISPGRPPDQTADDNTSQKSPSRSPHESQSKSGSRSRSRSNSSSDSRSRSPSGSRSGSRSKSRSPTPVSRRTTPSRSRGMTPVSGTCLSREATPTPSLHSQQTGELNGTAEQQGASLADINTPSQKNVSSYMLDRVRAIIRASKEAVKVEEDMFADDT